MNCPKLSLCMIVKNEEKMLPRCLDSVESCVDEIVVVDTGSTDRTVDIARQYGAKIYCHPWEGDFSKHQNQSVEYATGEWLLQMDADEALVDGSCRIIRNAIKDPKADAFFITVISFFNNGASSSKESKIRLFKNRPGIRYESIVHKQLRGYRCPKIISAAIHHYGYDLSPEEQETKFQRSSTLLKRQIAENPKNYWHRHNLAVSYASNFMFNQAIEEGTRALELAETQGLSDPNLPWTQYIVAASYLKLGDHKKAETAANRALLHDLDHLDSHFVLVLVYHQQKHWKKLYQHATAFFHILDLMISAPEQFAGTITNMAGEGWRVHLAMGDLHLNEDHLEKAKVSFEKAQVESPVPFECLKIIADCYKNLWFWKEAAHYYQSAIQKKPDYLEAVLGFALAQNRLGNKDNAIEAYRKAFQIKPDSLETLVNLGDLHYESGLVDKAQDLYEKAISLEPTLVNVALRLTQIAVKRGDIERCVDLCNGILKSLKISCNQTLECMGDLANIFLLIAHTLDKAGKEELFNEAVGIALRIDPDIVKKCMGPHDPSQAK